PTASKVPASIANTPIACQSTIPKKPGPQGNKVSPTTSCASPIKPIRNAPQNANDRYIASVRVIGRSFTPGRSARCLEDQCGQLCPFLVVEALEQLSAQLQAIVQDLAVAAVSVRIDAGPPQRQRVILRLQHRRYRFELRDRRIEGF